jgi:hypothetical protein
MKIREGTLRHHLAPPVFFGLLGESHVWKSADDPKDKIKAIVDEFDKEKVETPREGLDLLCVADLGYWGSIDINRAVSKHAEPADRSLTR